MASKASMHDCFQTTELPLDIVFSLGAQRSYNIVQNRFPSLTRGVRELNMKPDCNSDTTACDLKHEPSTDMIVFFRNKRSVKRAA